MGTMWSGRCERKPNRPSHLFTIRSPATCTHMNFFDDLSGILQCFQLVVLRVLKVVLNTRVVAQTNALIILQTVSMGYNDIKQSTECYTSHIAMKIYQASMFSFLQPL